MRDSVNCRVDEVRYFVKIVDKVRVDQVRVDQVRADHIEHIVLTNFSQSFNLAWVDMKPSIRSLKVEP